MISMGGLAAGARTWRADNTEGRGLSSAPPAGEACAGVADPSRDESFRKPREPSPTPVIPVWPSFAAGDGAARGRGSDLAPVRLGFIGYGIMGERLLRAAVRRDPGVIAVAGVWDPSSRAMERLAADFPALPRTASTHELIEASDCVYVASPPASHLGHAARILERGRAVFCEKPLAVDLEEARTFVKRAEEASVRAAVNFPFASSFAVDQVHAWMKEGAVGEVRSLRIEAAFATWPRSWQMDAASWLDRRAQGGFTREVLSHFLFLSRRMFGPLELRKAAVEYPNGEASERGIEAVLTAGEVPIRLSGGVGGTDEDDHNLWVLEGSAGSIRIRDWALPERLAGEGHWVAPQDALPADKARPLVLTRQLDKLAAMTRGEPHNLATLREALEVQEIVETMLRQEVGAAAGGR
jgi:predicted dehydrogenase